MSEWNVEMVRGTCLEMLGWRRETQTNFLDGKTDVIWIHSDGRERYEGLPYPDPLPDPTTSLDDALPLFVANDGTFIFVGPTDDGEAFVAKNGTYRQINKNPALAVCLLRLEFSGRDLNDFRVKP